jgi:hypothetical protein
MTVSVEQVNLYDRLTPQLAALRSEMALLSKGKPDNPLNKFKLLYVNQLLADANTLLTDAQAPLRGFKQFDEAAMPSNSDVVLVLSQYLTALESWRSANVKSIGYSWYWDTEVGAGSIRSDAPTRSLRDNA